MMRVLALLATLTLLSIQCVDARVFYIDQVRGNDRATGTIDRPYKSFVPTQLQARMVAGDSILLCKGQTWYGQHAYLSWQASADNPITIGSYKCDTSDEPPMVSGSNYLPSTWMRPHPTNPNLIQINYYGDMLVNREGMGAVWVNDDRRFPARTPSLIDYTVASIQSYDEFYTASPSTVTNGRIYSPNITQGTDYWKGARINMRTNNWTYQQSLIIASGPGWLQTDVWPYSGLCSGFFLETGTLPQNRNDFNPLLQSDAPGEWSYDQTTGWVNYYPVSQAERTGLLAGTSIWRWSYATDLPIISIIGNGYVIQDINLKLGMTGIFSQTSNSLKIYRTNIKHIAGFGIMTTRAVNAQIIDSSVFDADADCMYVDSAGGLVQGNHVSYCGMNAGYGFAQGGTSKGISAFQADVISNRVDHTGYSGIEPHAGSDVKYNVISDVLLTLNDGGGIYMFGSAGNGLNIESNIVSNVVGNYLSWTPWNIASCLFTDEGTSRINIYNNTCSNAPQCMQMNKANGNVILSNRCNSPGIYLNNGDSGGGHVVVGNQITTSGTDSILQNPISRIRSPGATQLTGVTAFYLNVYCQQSNNGNYLWQTDFGENGVTRFYNYNDWVWSECRGNTNCYFEQNSAFYYGNCDSRTQYFFATDNGRPIYVDTESKSNSAVIIGVVVAVVVVVVAVLVALVYYRSQKQSSADQSIERTLASLPNGMLPTVAPLHIRTSSTSSVDYEQYASPMNQCTASPQSQSSPRSDIELSPQYILHKTSSAPIASH